MHIVRPRYHGTTHTSHVKGTEKDIGLKVFFIKSLRTWIIEDYLPKTAHVTECTK